MCPHPPGYMLTLSRARVRDVALIVAGVPPMPNGAAELVRVQRHVPPQLVRFAPDAACCTRTCACAHSGVAARVHGSAPNASTFDRSNECSVPEDRMPIVGGEAPPYAS